MRPAYCGGPNPSGRETGAHWERQSRDPSGVILLLGQVTVMVAITAGVPTGLQSAVVVVSLVPDLL